ncbi:DUF2239 family protein [Ramlibacter sp. USB13]|uniref:DUF2239 family protein n=1 Tax=Ramlibacter cellulosilyticus TaxID=2764187 RepID=A0A923S9C7_9BURK|nr:DUF2239 family protein [Ramlibacter cellulosilyticus]MBC5781541.1 DUF2239 family protein [Ramlibacter cellulosilyticus]
MHPNAPHTAFAGTRRLASGPLREVALAVLQAQDPQGPMPLVFSDATGRQVELDLRGSEQEILARYTPAACEDAAPARGRGRPKLGVVAREVTLLPEHWEWLAAQPGGASVALRKLVHEARRAGSHRHRARQAQERAYHVMAALAGDLPGFEEAGRALFASDRERLASLMAPWPADVRDHVLRLADPDFDPVPPRKPT